MAKGANERDYIIGYGKPPAHAQFRKGRSGNANGRPKRPDTLIQAAAKILKEKLTITEAGRRRKLTILEIIILRLVNRATEGDLGAIATYESLEPKINLLLGEKVAWNLVWDDPSEPSEGS